jgi:hypothetical protein
MSNAADQAVLAAARESLAKPLRFTEFLAKLSPKDRASAERRVGVLDAEGDAAHAALWQRLACSLMTLAPHAAKLVGKQTLQLYVADGKYRMQVFALEDLQDGNMTVYCPDVIAECVAAGLLARQDGGAPGEPGTYTVVPGGDPLHVDALDKNAVNPANHFKDMIGWNRKAVRLTLPSAASEAQVEAVELACAVAATHFPPAAASTAAPTNAAGTSAASVKA